MKIDFKKLQKLEAQLTSAEMPGGVVLEKNISRFTLQKMVQVVLDYNESSFKLAPNNVRTAINTLVDLKILIEDENVSPPVQQLNS